MISSFAGILRRRGTLKCINFVYSPYLSAFWQVFSNSVEKSTNAILIDCLFAFLKLKISWFPDTDWNCKNMDEIGFSRWLFVKFQFFHIFELIKQPWKSFQMFKDFPNFLIIKYFTEKNVHEFWMTYWATGLYKVTAVEQ